MDILTESEFFTRVRRQCEAQEGHRRDEDARDNQVEEVVERPAPNVDLVRDVHVRFGAALVIEFVAFPGDR